MKLDYYESPLIILGGWNPNIINARWIDNYLVKPMISNGKSIKQVDIEVKADQMHSIRDAPITISFGEVRIIFTGNKLEFRLIDNKNFNLLEEYALRICDCLPNTPVIGYGVNFGFTDEKISEITANTINAIQSKNFNRPLILEQYNFALRLDDIRTNIGIDINHEDNKSGFRFNFHFDIDSLSKFKLGISEHPIRELKEKTVKILSDVYGLRLED